MCVNLPYRCKVLEIVILLVNFLKGFYLFTFRERGGEGEREGGKHQCVRYINLLPLTHP